MFSEKSGNLKDFSNLFLGDFPKFSEWALLRKKTESSGKLENFIIRTFLPKFKNSVFQMFRCADIVKTRVLSKWHKNYPYLVEKYYALSLLNYFCKNFAIIYLIWFPKIDEKWTVLKTDIFLYLSKRESLPKIYQKMGP